VAEHHLALEPLGCAQADQVWYSHLMYYQDSGPQREQQKTMNK
jgi:hypothetical protein